MHPIEPTQGHYVSSHGWVDEHCERRALGLARLRGALVGDWGREGIEHMIERLFLPFSEQDSHPQLRVLR